MNIIFYKLDDQEIDNTILDTLKDLGFLITKVSLPNVYNGCPTPVAHFCDKGVMFGQEAILSFAKWLKQEEK